MTRFLQKWEQFFVEILAHQLRESQSYIIVGCNINNLLSDFDSEAKDVMNNIAPLRTTIITGYFILPWYNHYIHITKTTAKDS